MTSPNPDEDNNVPGNNPPESNLDDSFDAFDSFFDDAEEGAAEETVESLREERDALKKQAEESVNALTYITDSNVKTRAALETIDLSITGFNIGMNCGPSAGQTVMHFHAHIIPRRHGDMADPRGGVRGVIPEKQKY